MITKDAPTPMTIIAAAIESKMPPEALEKLMGLQERWEANEARKAYSEAIVSFQTEMPIIYKETKGAKSNYATYDTIMRIAGPILKKWGLAISFSQKEDENLLTVMCQIRHKAGHCEDFFFSVPKEAPPTTKDGRAIINKAQMQGSANAYAKRYCLTNALNIVTSDDDDDAKALDAPVQLVTNEQAAELETLREQADADLEKVFTHYGIDSFDTAPAKLYNRIKAGLMKAVARKRAMANQKQLEGAAN